MGPVAQWDQSPTFTLGEHRQDCLLGTDQAGSAGGPSECETGDAGRAAFFRFFFDRMRACSNVQSVTTTAIISGTTMTMINKRYSCVPIQRSRYQPRNPLRSYQP
jgi:hypothetical protein